MRIVTTLVAIFGIALLASAASAGEGCGAYSAVQKIFDTADTDGNGALTRAEYAEARLERFGVSFEESDANADGETSLPEYIELYERHHSGGERVEI